jgi:hypothetical protein
MNQVEKELNEICEDEKLKFSFYEYIVCEWVY